MNNSKEFNLDEIFALKKAQIKEMEALKPGCYEVDFTVHIKGKIRKAEDEEAANTVSILSLPVLAKAFQIMGIQQKNFIKALQKAAEAVYFSETQTATDHIARTHQLDHYIQEIQEKIISRLPKQKKSGKLTAKLEITKIK